MDERSGRDDNPQPLFLDEPPETPRYSKRPSVAIDELFRDESVWTPTDRHASASRVQRVQVEVRAPIARARPLRITSTGFLIMLLAAAFLGFTAVSAWLR
jgi:hypothetical protein